MRIDHRDEGIRRANSGLRQPNSRRPRGSERGQAMVEFVLVLFPLIVLVGGVIQLGIGVANWHDLNRIANEGARFAAVNEWPDCPSSAATCTGNPQCNNTAALPGRSLVNYLRCEAQEAGFSASAVCVAISQPNGAFAGEPVTVKLRSRINFLSLDILDLNKVKWMGVDVRGEATMRASEAPTKYAAVGTC